MSRYSLNSSLALFQSVLTDPDATSSSTSSSSAINNSSNSLSVSPAVEREFKINTKQSQQQISNHLLELQREIKEEEDEIFADINSLINNRSDLYSLLDDTDYEDSYNNSRNYASLNRQTIVTTNTDSISNSTNNIINNNNNTIGQQQQYYNLPDDDHGYAQDDSDLIENEENIEQQGQLLLEQQRHQFENEELENQISNEDESDYVSCNLVEQQQLHQQQQQNYQNAIQQQKDIQQVTSNLPKPCVFFLEGNCRRSDCKYSHDLSSITCKYWIEGFCFKGEMCPFLHSFAPTIQQDSNLSDDDGLGLSKKNLTPNFVIESEADFPSLPLDAPNETTQKIINSGSLTKTIKHQILSSNPAVIFKSTKKKRKKG